MWRALCTATDVCEAGILLCFVSFFYCACLHAGLLLAPAVGDGWGFSSSFAIAIRAVYCRRREFIERCGKSGGVLAMVGFNKDSITSLRRVHGMTGHYVTGRHRNDRIIIILSTVKGAASGLVTATGRVARRPSHERLSVLLAANRRISMSLVTVALVSVNIDTISLGT